MEEGICVFWRILRQFLHELDAFYELSLKRWNVDVLFPEEMHPELIKLLTSCHCRQIPLRPEWWPLFPLCCQTTHPPPPPPHPQDPIVWSIYREKRGAKMPWIGWERVAGWNILSSSPTESRDGDMCLRWSNVLIYPSIDCVINATVDTVCLSHGALNAFFYYIF